MLNHFLIFIVIVLLQVMPGACDRKEEHSNISHIQSSGLPFRITKGPHYGAGFSMRDDKGRKTSSLYAASTPFSVDTAGEERSFTIEVNPGGRPGGDFFEFRLRINFKDADYAEVARLTALEIPWKNGTCVEVGEPLSFYIRITQSGKENPVFEKTESRVCKNAATKNSVYKRIARTRLLPGSYTVYVRNELATLAFQKYDLAFLLMQTHFY